jgi:8-oxo-dGTP pyrophosphatase MutT (NUDIX family)
MTAFDKLRHLLSLFRPPDEDGSMGDSKPLRQAAAAVFRGKTDRRELLLITSRDTGRWIVPKGWIENDEDGPAAALREAWEEAGVIGELVSPRSIGHYRYLKQRPRRGDALCDVDVYVFNLKEEKKRWPEKAERTRQWFPVEEAIGLVDEPGLKDVIRDAVELGKAA